MSLQFPTPIRALRDDANITKAVLSQQNGPTVLVGHSYGGAVISENGWSSQCEGIGLCLLLFLLDAGESLFKMLSGAPPDPNSPIFTTCRRLHLVGQGKISR